MWIVEVCQIIDKRHDGEGGGGYVVRSDSSIVIAPSLSAEVKARWCTSHQPVASIFAGLTELWKTILQIEIASAISPAWHGKRY
jgi:hypothetical protein